MEETKELLFGGKGGKPRPKKPKRTLRKGNSWKRQMLGYKQAKHTQKLARFNLKTTNSQGKVDKYTNKMAQDRAKMMQIQAKRNSLSQPKTKLEGQLMTKKETKKFNKDTKKFNKQTKKYDKQTKKLEKRIGSHGKKIGKESKRLGKISKKVDKSKAKIQKWTNKVQKVEDKKTEKLQDKLDKKRADYQKSIARMSNSTKSSRFRSIKKRFNLGKDAKRYNAAKKSLKQGETLNTQNNGAMNKIISQRQMTKTVLNPFKKSHTRLSKYIANKGKPNELLERSKLLQSNLTAMKTKTDNHKTNASSYSQASKKLSNPDGVLNTSNARSRALNSINYKAKLLKFKEDRLAEYKKTHVMGKNAKMNDAFKTEYHKKHGKNAFGNNYIESRQTFKDVKGFGLIGPKFKMSQVASDVKNYKLDGIKNMYYAKTGFNPNRLANLDSKMKSMALNPAEKTEFDKLTKTKQVFDDYKKKQEFRKGRDAFIKTETDKVKNSLSNLQIEELKDQYHTRNAEKTFGKSYVGNRQLYKLSDRGKLLKTLEPTKISALTKIISDNTWTAESMTKYNELKMNPTRSLEEQIKFNDLANKRTTILNAIKTTVNAPNNYNPK